METPERTREEVKEQTTPQFPKIIDVRQTVETICRLSPKSLYGSPKTKQVYNK